MKRIGALEALAIMSITLGIIAQSINCNGLPPVIGINIYITIKLHNIQPPTLIKTIKISERYTFFIVSSEETKFWKIFI